MSFRISSLPCITLLCALGLALPCPPLSQIFPMGGGVVFNWLIFTVVATRGLFIFCIIFVHIFLGNPIRALSEIFCSFSVAFWSAQISANISYFYSGIPGIHLRCWSTDSWVSLVALYMYHSVSPSRCRVYGFESAQIPSGCSILGYFMSNSGCLNICAPLY